MFLFLSSLPVFSLFRFFSFLLFFFLLPLSASGRTSRSNGEATLRARSDSGEALLGMRGPVGALSIVPTRSLIARHVLSNEAITSSCTKDTKHCYRGSAGASDPEQTNADTRALFFLFLFLLLLRALCFLRGFFC